MRDRTGFGTAAGAPEDVREGRERLTLSPGVARARDRGKNASSERPDRVVRLIGEVALVRTPCEQPDATSWGGRPPEERSARAY